VTLNLQVDKIFFSPYLTEEYPIWWGEAPRIVSTFVESYDFSGKTIIPFCTSGGSGIGSSSDTLETLAGNGTWLEGKRFSGGESGEDVIKSLGIE
jgi:hypothetical protein